MELEKLRELIEKTRSIKTNPACLELADQFEVFVELFQQQKDGLADENYFKRFEATLKQFWATFDKAAESLGLSPDTLKANINNPDYFAPAQWNAIQSIKQEITGEKPGEQKPKILKANKKRMRI